MIILPCIYWFFFIFPSINLQSYSYIVNFSLQIPMKFKNVICLVSPNKQNNKSRLRNNVRKAWRSKDILSSHFKSNMYRGQYRSPVASKTVLGKGLPKICSKFTEEYPCRSAISVKLQSNIIEIALRHGCSPLHLLHIFRTPFPKNTSGGLLMLFFPYQNSTMKLLFYL